MRDGDAHQRNGDPEEPEEHEQKGRAAAVRARAARALGLKLDRVMDIAQKLPGWIYFTLFLAASGALFPFGGIDEGLPGTAFDQWLLVWLARIVALAASVVLLAAGFLMLRSIFGRIEEKQWLFKVGPVETEQADKANVETALKDLDEWRERSGRLEVTVEDLTQRLGEANGQITVLEAALRAQGSPQEDFRMSRANPPA